MGKNVIKRYGEGVLFSLMLGSSLNGYSQGLTFDVNAAPKGNIPGTLYGVFLRILILVQMEVCMPNWSRTVRLNFPSLLWGGRCLAM